MASSLAPPVFVPGHVDVLDFRGRNGQEHPIHYAKHADESKLAALVLDAMKECGWSGAAQKSIRVKNCSGYGGGTTFKVSCEGVSPEAVALHVRTKVIDKNPLGDERMKVAAGLLVDIGLAPSLLAYGSDWFIERWEGIGRPRFTDIEGFRELGRFTARIHRIPTHWFDKWRSKVSALLPWLCEAPLGSSVWWFTARDAWLENMKDMSLEVFCGESFFEPASSAARQIVTCHGDLHPENMLQCDGGLKCIDFEFTSVTSAVLDLGRIFSTHKPWRLDGISAHREEKRALVEAYLQELELPAAPADVDLVYLDAELDYLSPANLTGPLAIFVWAAHCGQDNVGSSLFKAKWAKRVKFWKAVGKKLRSDAHLQAQVLAGRSIKDLMEQNPELLALRETDGGKRSDVPEKTKSLVIKEGRRRGAEIARKAEKEGLQFYCTSMKEPDGDIDLLVDSMNVLNAANEEHNVGSQTIGKMVFSTGGSEQLAIVAYVPESKFSVLDGAEWLNSVLSIGTVGKLTPPMLCTFTVESRSPEMHIASFEYDPHFPTTDRIQEVVIPGMLRKANDHLRKKGLFPEEEEDNEELMGWDDFF